MFNKSGLTPSENLSLSEFIDLIKESDRSDLTSHYYKIKYRLKEQKNIKLLYEQLFSFYCNQWDGTCPEATKTNKGVLQNIYKEQVQKDLILDLDTNMLSIINSDNQTIFDASLSANDLIERITQHYNFPSLHREKKIICFVKDDYYGDWLQSRYLEREKPCIILGAKNSKLHEFISELDINFKNHSTKTNFIFEINILENPIDNDYWEGVFSNFSKKHSIENGLKISRKAWMLGAGPDIHLKPNTLAWINGDKITTDKLSLRDRPVGIYTLKVKNYTPVEIKITKPDYNLTNNDCGWHVSKKDTEWTFDKKHCDISGLLTFFPKQAQDNLSDVRRWINILISKSKIDVQCKSQTMKATKRAKYGV